MNEMTQAEYVKRYRPTVDRKISFEAVLVAYSYDRMGIFLRASHIMPIVHAKGLSYELPVQHTLNPPPHVPPGYVAVYAPAAGKWHVLEDHRGETWIDFGGRKKVIERPGNPLNWGLQHP